MKRITTWFAFFLLVLILAGCEENTVMPENSYDFLVKNSETYSFNLNIWGDEEDAIILEHPNNYEISELKRDSSTNWSVTYFYKPETGYIGPDSVKIETNTGSDGASAGITDTLSIVFLVAH